MITYRRSTIETLTKTKDRSLLYWRSQARQIFAGRSDIEKVHISRSGGKMELIDAGVISKGSINSNPGEWAIVASTGGKWGKSRRDFYPAASAVLA